MFPLLEGGSLKTVADFEWTEERVEQLKELFAKRATKAQMATHFGVSLNSVVGKIHRLGLFRRSTTSSKAKTPATVVDQAATPGKTFEELQRHHCRYPFGEVGTESFFYCGKTRSGNLPYCPEHAALCFNGMYNPPSTSRRFR